MLAVALVLSVCAVAGTSVQSRDWMALHRRALGGDAAIEAARELEIVGSLEGTMQAEYLAQVRSSPFGFRESVTFPDGATRIFGSDGRSAWAVGPDGELAPLSGHDASLVLDYAFFGGLAYLSDDFVDARNDGPLTPPELFTMPPEVPRAPPCAALRLRSPSGLRWDAYIGLEDGRLHALVESGTSHGRWARFGGWRKFGALEWPSLRVDGRAGSPVTEILRIRELRQDVALDDELFRPPGDPTVGPYERIAPLHVVPSALAGHAMFIVPEVELNHAARVPALFDTGISGIGVEPGLATSLGLHRGGSELVNAAAGPAMLGIAWIEHLALGTFALTQIQARTAPLMFAMDLPQSRQALVHLGSSRILQYAPVLDLAEGALYFRASPALPLARTGPSAAWPPAERGGLGDLGALPVVVEVALEYAPGDTNTFTVEVTRPGGLAPARLLLDYGMQSCLRLSPSGLARLGLAEDVAAWRRAGAMAIEVGGVSGVTVEEWLMRGDRFDLGALTFLEPWITVGTKQLDPELDGWLGAGALIELARVGLDPGRMLLELEAGPSAIAREDSRIEIPPPGECLGLGLLCDEPPPAAGRGGAPLVALVLRGGPGERAGIEVNDLLIEVDGCATSGMSHAEVCRRLWVPRGAAVELALLRAGAEEVIRVRLP